jgi:hypothetical protein
VAQAGIIVAKSVFPFVNNRMDTFREFLEQADGPDGGEVPHVHAPIWHASKEEIIQMWTNLKPSPVQMAPIPENQKGTRLHNDGLRITGSAPFINSVLSRLKDLLAYERNPGTRLDLEYREIESKVPNSTPNYLCYIHVEQDLKKKTAPALSPPQMEKPFEKKIAGKPSSVLKTAFPGA